MDFTRLTVFFLGNEGVGEYQTLDASSVGSDTIAQADTDALAARCARRLAPGGT